MSRSEDGFNLMLDHFLYCISSRFQVVSWVEVGRILVKGFSDSACHGKADIGVDIDLAYGHGGSFAEHIFRYAFGTKHLAAVLIAFFHKFRNDGGSAVEYDGVVRQKSAYFSRRS